jgi:hypothetical protein
MFLHFLWSRIAFFIHTSISEILQSNTVVHQMQIDMFIQVRLKLTRLYLAEIKEAVVNFFRSAAG